MCPNFQCDYLSFALFKLLTAAQAVFSRNIDDFDIKIFRKYITMSNINGKHFAMDTSWAPIDKSLKKKGIFDISNTYLSNRI